ncbi:MAG: ABC transporter permease subunit [Verrucomicrobiaceae bacterium]|nr:ABC transporter permease subunit [Verrucomicrobiaceae bacterium]
MSPRTTGIALIVFTVLSAAQKLAGLYIPVLKLPFLGGNILGWVLLTALLIIGVRLARAGRSHWNVSPLTQKKLRRFVQIRRGYISFLVLLGLTFVASLDSLLVGKRALMVSYQGKWSFPFVREVIPGKAYGQETDAETDYRELQKECRRQSKGDWVIMPPVPYDPALDTPEIIEQLDMENGKLLRHDRPFSGVAYTVFVSNPSLKRQEFQFRDGVRHGEFRGWDEKGDQIEQGTYFKGERKSYKDYTEGKAAALEPQAGPLWQRLVYPPAPPSITQMHYLGTNTTGNDVLAMLYGGLQQALIAAVLFVTVVFTAGILIGGTLGYFGGWVDLLGQRLIEIWQVLPFLFIVMIISSLISPTLTVLVVVLAAFGWMGTTMYLRTATFKEKQRDYVAAARLLGASTPRIIFHHVLPNVIAILVTLAPFEVAGVITALASLDFLGFGLPPDVPSWGRLLHEGVDNFNYPWIVTSAFICMGTTLVLVTFVGEAVREAFDPKKFTTYE